MNEIQTRAKTLTAEEYLDVQGRLRTLAEAALAMISDEDLAAFIAQAERAQSLGPILDPTLWAKGHAQLRLVTEHARALATFRQHIRGALP